MYSDELLKPWLAPLTQAVEPELFDCHTHVGQHDPSGFSVTAEQLPDSLDLSGGRAAVFPLKEPEGYGGANHRVIGLAQENQDRLVAFARLDPADQPLEHAQDAFGAGERGLKLHPASDEFDIGDPRLDPVYKLADAERLPIIVHAGPEIDGLGKTALSLCPSRCPIITPGPRCSEPWKTSSISTSSIPTPSPTRISSPPAGI